MSTWLHRRCIIPLLHVVRGDRPGGVIRNLEERQWHSADRIRTRQERCLHAVLESAAALPHYRRRFAEAGVDWKTVQGLADLPSLPVLEKRELADGLKDGSFGPRRGFARETAGTSGIPLRMTCSKEASAWTMATRMLCYSWYGVRSGDREARFWGRPLEGPTVKAKLRNRLLNREVFSGDDLRPANWSATLERYRKKRPAFIYGYASLISEFGRLVEQEGADGLDLPAPKLIVTTAVQSMAEERRRLSRIFGCPVANEYGCSEVDIIAFECPEGAMHVMSENVVVEAVPDPAAPGLRTAVITDLHNLATPLVRYRLGDAIALGDAPCSCGRGSPILKTVLGRSRNQFVILPSGEKVHASVFSHAFEEVMKRGFDIEVFRVEQCDRRTIRIDVQLGESSDKEGLELAMTELLSSLVSEGLAIVWRYPGSIERVVDGKYSHFHALQE